MIKPRFAKKIKCKGYVDDAQVNVNFFIVHSDQGGCPAYHITTLPDGTAIKDYVICMLGSWHYTKNCLVCIFELVHHSEMRFVAEMLGWGSDGAYGLMIHVGCWKKSHEIVRDILRESMLQALVFTVSKSKRSTNKDYTVTVKDVNEYLEINTNSAGGEGMIVVSDSSFANHCRLLFFLDAYEAMMAGIDGCNDEMHDCGRIILLFLFQAFHHSNYVRDGILELIMVLFQFTEDLKEHRRKFFSIVDKDGVGKAYDFVMENKNDILQNALPNGLVTEAGVDRASLYMDKLPLIKRKIEGVIGKTISDIRNSHTQNQYDAHISQLSNHLYKIGYWIIIPGRTVTYGFEGKHPIKDEVTPIYFEDNASIAMMSNIERAIRKIEMQHPPSMSQRSLMAAEVLKKENLARARKKKKIELANEVGVEEGIDETIQE